ncbi:MAG: hypothetical protein ACFFCW_07575 [Candidatus Hodarchaeota archaeon]
MPLPESLQGVAWTPSIARKLLPLLVSYAEACQPVTYGELSKEAVQRKWSHLVIPVAYRYPAGAIGYAIEKTEEEWQKPIPPINAIVINEHTRMPGKGVDYFLKTYLRQTGSKRRLTKHQRESIVEEIHKDVFNYSGWRDLLQYYGLSEPPELQQPLINLKPKRKYKWSGEAESEAHKKLKQFVANNPWVVDLPRKTPKGKGEYILPSADKIDVLFQHGPWDVAVEVKASNANDDDLLRGIYQCVKYRELLRAEKRVIGSIPQIRALLVTERNLPREHQRIADTLKVEWKKVDLTTTYPRKK